MRKVSVAATQMSCTWDREKTLEKADKLVRKAASLGANIILLQELFETPYFCQKEKYEYLEIASTVKDNIAINHFKEVAKELKVVLPISFYERAGNTFFNSLVVIDADGSVSDVYRKTHIPDGHCYEEKFYFSPGDTGFKVFDTMYGKIGVAICWDQWFPETARSLALLGAEIIFYPTAIGSEPILSRDSKDHWQRCIQGHSAANLVPIVASNRVGVEKEEESSMTFYGSSFITGCYGEILKQLNREEEDVIVQEFDLDENQKIRYSWGVFRDRRPEMYKGLLKMDNN